MARLPKETKNASMDEWTTLEALGHATAQLRSLATRGSFSREGGVSIQFCNFRQENAKHHVLLLTGWDESFIKYGDVISELLAAGFSVYTMDWRSQGLSGRLLLDPQVTYVESFEDHLGDLHFFIDQVVGGDCGVDASELTCLAHSMGGLISLMMAVTSTAGKRRFRRLVACSPMLRMKAGMPHPVALRLGQLLCAMGLGKRYAPGEGAVDVARPITKKLTTDKERLSTWEKIRRTFPIVAMGGMSNRWVVEAIKAQDWFETRAARVTIPVLVLEADVDAFVCTSRPFSKLCLAVRDCWRLQYPTTYHEILFEQDWARSHAMQATIAFLKSGVAPEDKFTVVPTPPPVADSRPTAAGGAVSQLCRRLFSNALTDVDDQDRGDGHGGGCSLLEFLKGKGDRRSYEYLTVAVYAATALGAGYFVGKYRCGGGGGGGGEDGKRLVLR